MVCLNSFNGRPRVDAMKREEFKESVREWAAKLDVKVQAITLRPMKNKWASCSTAGKLNFNAELLDFDQDVADYVIVHELLHFFVPNHGKLWKSLMRAHLGDYEHLEEELRRASPERFDAERGGKEAAPTPARTRKGRFRRSG